VTTKQLAAEGTQKQMDSPLLNKVRMRQSEFGSSVSDMFRAARRLHNAFFGAPKLDEEPEITAEWEPIDQRDEDVELARAVMKVMQLQIPVEEVWAELGYPEAKIAKWKIDAEIRKQEMMKQMQQQGQMQNGQPGQGGKPSDGQPPKQGAAPQMKGSPNVSAK
jgi:hypothetical protein